MDHKDKILLNLKMVKLKDDIDVDSIEIFKKKELDKEKV
jgi:hypothetical protein